MTDEKQLEYEMNQEKLHARALRVCEHIAENNDIKNACISEDISVSAFFRTKRDNPDVQAAFIEAKEVAAELRLAKIDEMKEQMLLGELDKDLFTAAFKAEQWVITKLRPDLFCTRTSVSVSGIIEHSPAKALSQMTDEQILQIAGFSQSEIPVGDSSTSAAGEDDIAEFEEIVEEDKKIIDNDKENAYIDSAGDEPTFSPKNSSFLSSAAFCTADMLSPSPIEDSALPSGSQDSFKTADNVEPLDLSMFGG
jgi:hypothetical protein